MADESLNSQISRLKDVSQKVISSEEDFEKQLVQQFGAIRSQHGLPIDDYCEILGITKSLYHKILSGDRRLSLGLLLRLCRTFNLDLATMTGEAYLRSADSVFRETALLLGRLDSDTIASLSDTVERSNEPDCIKERCQVLLDRMCELREASDSNPPIFFGADMP